MICNINEASSCSDIDLSLSYSERSACWCFSDISLSSHYWTRHLNKSCCCYHECL